MTPINFIHCADTHLGKIQKNSSRRFEDFLDSFEDVVNYAVSENVDFIVVAGDFFDKRNINPDTFSKTFCILKKLKKHNIPLIACEGNHDKTFYGNKLSWMETLAEIGYIILLKPGYDEKGNIKYTGWDENNKRGFYYDINPKIRIFGLGYLGSEADERFCEISRFLFESKNNYNKFNIVLIHGIIKKYQSDFIGTISSDSVNNLKNCCDYIALGHQHTRYEHENFAFNPGSLEYWDIKEVKHDAGKKGFYHVRVDEAGKIETGFKESSKRFAIYLEVDISGTKNPDDVYFLIREKLRQRKQDNKNINKNINNIYEPIIQVVLGGKVTYDVMEIDTKFLKEKISEEFGALLVDIDTDKILFTRFEHVIAQDMSREEIEKQVIGDYVEQAGRFLGYEDKTTELVLNVISLSSASQTQDNCEEIYKTILNCDVKRKKIEPGILGTNNTQKSILDFG
ncbi:hypothetical protein BEH94_11980 [Candidatus Altiarchaeales archaeon WOR_SM1_SCG]|nr:hypothetical protein BEH94_11980 [Candidatus Altiarchaeales archaeon WOR_SM1_SCG]